MGHALYALNRIQKSLVTAPERVREEKLIKVQNLLANLRQPYHDFVSTLPATTQHMGAMD